MKQVSEIHGFNLRLLSNSDTCAEQPLVSKAAEVVEVTVLREREIESDQGKGSESAWPNSEIDDQAGNHPSSFLLYIHRVMLYRKIVEAPE